MKKTIPPYNLALIRIYHLITYSMPINNSLAILETLKKDVEDAIHGYSEHSLSFTRTMSTDISIAISQTINALHLVKDIEQQGKIIDAIEQTVSEYKEHGMTMEASLPIMILLDCTKELGSS